MDIVKNVLKGSLKDYWMIILWKRYKENWFKVRLFRSCKNKKIYFLEIRRIYSKWSIENYKIDGIIFL